MGENKQYEIIKDIPLSSDGSVKIKAGKLLTYTHGVFYLDGGMLPQSYQEDFKQLIYAEECNGWNYLVPIKQKTAFTK